MSRYSEEDIHTFAERIVTGAGVRTAGLSYNAQVRIDDDAAPVSQMVVEALISAVMTVRSAKAASYGDRRYSYLRSDRMELAMMFCDLQRKMDRLEAMIFNDDASVDESLLDAVADITGYGLMGLETLFYIEHRRRESGISKDPTT